MNEHSVPFWAMEQQKLLMGCMEVFNRARGERTFIGENLSGTIVPETITPREMAELTIHIPRTYFDTLGTRLDESDKKKLILGLIQGFYYSDRSKIAQAGGATFFAGMLQGISPPDMDNLIVPRADGNGWDVKLVTINHNPVRQLKFPNDSSEYLRLYIPGIPLLGQELAEVSKQLIAGGMVELVDGGGTIVTDDFSGATSVRLPIGRFARYQPNDTPIEISSLNPRNRDQFDRDIGLIWADEPTSDLPPTAQMFIGETRQSIRMPSGYAGVIVQGVEDDGGYYHQHSTLIDPGFEGTIRTEHTTHGGKPTHIDLNIYKV